MKIFLLLLNCFYVVYGISFEPAVARDPSEFLNPHVFVPYQGKQEITNEVIDHDPKMLNTDCELFENGNNRIPTYGNIGVVLKAHLNYELRCKSELDSEQYGGVIANVEKYTTIEINFDVPEQLKSNGGYNSQRLKVAQRRYDVKCDQPPRFKECLAMIDTYTFVDVGDLFIGSYKWEARIGKKGFQFEQLQKVKKGTFKVVKVEGLAGENGPCKFDDQCGSKKCQGRCICSAEKPIFANNTCLGLSQYKQNCSSDEQCQRKYLSNGTIATEKHNICVSGFCECDNGAYNLTLPDYGTTCRSTIKIDETCTDTVECKLFNVKSFCNDSMSCDKKPSLYCHEPKCECEVGYNVSIGTHATYGSSANGFKCLRSAKCANTAHCDWMENSLCDTETGNCVCKEKYVRNDFLLACQYNPHSSAAALGINFSFLLTSLFLSLTFYTGIVKH